MKKGSSISLKKPLAIGKGLFWTIISGLILFFLVAVVAPYFSLTEAAFTRWWDVKYWLVGHIIGGLAALLIGPIQFIPSVRTKFRKLHKRLGKMYVAGIAIGTICSIFLAFTTALALHWTWTVALLALATAWVLTTSMAIFTIKRGLVEFHRKWMIRSYIVTFSAVLFRLLFSTLMDAGAGTPAEVGPSMLWISWAIPLLVSEVIMGVGAAKQKQAERADKKGEESIMKAA